jgi:glucose/arabinose dehydrogenase
MFGRFTNSAWRQAAFFLATSLCTHSALCIHGTTVDAQVPFAIQGPGVDAAHYRLTTFATGLNFPVGMAQLDDGSMLVAVTKGTNFFAANQGAILRLHDSDGDGVADEQTTVFDSVPGGRLSALRRAGDLVFVTGQGSGVPISVFRLGDAASDPLTLIGRFQLNYPAGSWLHPHSALAARQLEDEPGTYELYFQLGSDSNFATTTRRVNLTSDLGLESQIAGDAIHRITLQDTDTGLSAVGIEQIATGLRNAAGMEFHPRTGDLYLQDNGIDGVQDANEPTSADELNRIAAADVGGAIEDFGFPASYIEYRTGNVIGGEGIAPEFAFLPIPDLATGDEAEGPNDIAFAPEMFPRPLRNGVFVGMHGKFSLGGLANEENPLVFANLNDGSYFHFISNREPQVGHLDGLLSTSDSLFLADISPEGGFRSSNANSGVIYQIQSLIPDIDQLTRAILDGSSEPRFDLNGDMQIDQSDRRTLIQEVHDTVFGDSNMDGLFDSGDLVAVFAAGLYEDAEPLNASWATGDWNGDLEFSTGDLVHAFQEGGYQTGADTAAVPEPSYLVWWATCLVFVQTLRTRKSTKCHIFCQ